MYRILLFSLFWCTSATAQNVGIGTGTPAEKLEVAGAIKIGTTNTPAPAAGTIRWNPALHDFEGFNGTAWVSLTGGKGAWGNQASYALENGTANHLLGRINAAKVGSSYGYSLSTDNIHMVVGAPFDYDEANANSGKVGSLTFFYWNNHTWTSSGTFIPSQYAGDELLGFSVSLAGDRAAAGAPQADINGKVRQGRVLIVSRPYPQRDDYYALTSSDGAASDHFGHSVSFTGTSLLAGAPYKKVGADNWQGKAYFFTPFLNGWIETEQFTAPDGAANDLFGSAVAQNNSWAAIGAPGATAPSEKAGKVYLFRRSNNNWTYHGQLSANIHHGSFGSALHLSGDTLVVGAPHNVPGNTVSIGQVYVYVRSGTEWNLQATLRAPDAAGGDGFGQ
ncbi:MAG TPA: FG-GAP repeat protein, partial [Chitinophagaceae bacterium]|nr:FG-GAP repeat protein [Chitinophagaceae bacterium]